MALYTTRGYWPSWAVKPEGTNWFMAETRERHHSRSPSWCRYQPEGANPIRVKGALVVSAKNLSTLENHTRGLLLEGTGNWSRCKKSEPPEGLTDAAREALESGETALVFILPRGLKAAPQVKDQYRRNWQEIRGLQAEEAKNVVVLLYPQEQLPESGRTYFPLSDEDKETIRNERTAAVLKDWEGLAEPSGPWDTEFEEYSERVEYLEELDRLERLSSGPPLSRILNLMDLMGLRFAPNVVAAVFEVWTRTTLIKHKDLVSLRNQRDLAHPYPIVLEARDTGFSPKLAETRRARFIGWKSVRICLFEDEQGRQYPVRKGSFRYEFQGTGKLHGYYNWTVKNLDLADGLRLAYIPPEPKANAANRAVKDNTAIKRQVLSMRDSLEKAAALDPRVVVPGDFKQVALDALGYEPTEYHDMRSWAHRLGPMVAWRSSINARRTELPEEYRPKLLAAQRVPLEESAFPDFPEVWSLFGRDNMDYDRAAPIEPLGDDQFKVLPNGDFGWRVKVDEPYSLHRINPENPGEIQAAVAVLTSKPEDGTATLDVGEFRTVTEIPEELAEEFATAAERTKS